MLKLTRVVIVTALVVSSLGAIAGRASGEARTGGDAPDDPTLWGFYLQPERVSPDFESSVVENQLHFLVAPVGLWRLANAIAPADELARRQRELIEAAHGPGGCQRNGPPFVNTFLGFEVGGNPYDGSFNARAVVLDHFGQEYGVQTHWESLSGRSLRGLPRGRYFLQVRCRPYSTTYFRTNVVVCTRFHLVHELLPPLEYRVQSGGTLARVPCPAPARGLLSIVSAFFRRVADQLELAARGSGRPSTTTTTRRAGSSGGGGGAPPGDAVAPVVSAVSLSGTTICQAVNVSASVSDAVGVTSATVQWGGAPGSGSMAMSGAGGSWSAVISPPAGFANPGTLTVTVYARDAVGNVGTGSSSIELSLC